MLVSLKIFWFWLLKRLLGSWSKPRVIELLKLFAVFSAYDLPYRFSEVMPETKPV